MRGTSEARFGPDWSASLRRGSDAELRGWVETALGWCDDTDRIALEHFRAHPHTIRKPDGTFVTTADTSIEAFVLDRLTETYPTHGAFGEELGDRPGSSGISWYIDPIDGTHNYLRGVPIFGTLLAVERDGELQAAVVSAPAMGGRWYGWRGGGAWARTLGDEAPRRIAVSAIATIDDASILYTSRPTIDRSGLAPGFDSLLEAAWRDRGFGDFWSYMLVAEGAADAMVEVGLKPWDAAAPTLLVEEAGGRVTDLDSRRSVDAPSILATNGHLHEAMRSILAGRG
ncbi:MAG TPA: inositol monophosphatase family protein [Candidatus Limnocylindria bacterium]|nr:inositol monophosphatase family protein [Candidatus Limnocylindria bacterium]